jgi:thiamine-phosphate pyrophosphorylase
MPPCRRQLPALYLITPQPGASDTEFLRGLSAALDSRVDALPLVRFRAHGLSPQRWRRLAAGALRACRERGALLLLGPDAAAGMSVDELFASGADGVHLPSRVLMHLDTVARPAGRLLAASCHDAAQLLQAQRLGADLVTLSPVLPTTSHPGAPGLGWQRLRELCRGTRLPVYALGGLGEAELGPAREAGAHGVAAIRGLWPGALPRA